VLATASGDDPDYIATICRWFPEPACRTTVLRLFLPPFAAVDEVVADADVVYVAGGSTRSMLAVWREHGVDRALRQAWERGTLLAGASAGSICWFEEGLVQALGGGYEPFVDGPLGLIAGSHCPHYGHAPARGAYLRAVADGRLSSGWAVDDGAALVIAPGGETTAITTIDGASAHRVESASEGAAQRTLDARHV
jgi:peptidase E